jgi:hypothetical protein
MLLHTYRQRTPTRRVLVDSMTLAHAVQNVQKFTPYFGNVQKFTPRPTWLLAEALSGLLVGDFQKEKSGDSQQRFHLRLEWVSSTSLHELEFTPKRLKVHPAMN